MGGTPSVEELSSYPLFPNFQIVPSMHSHATTTKSDPVNGNLAGQRQNQTWENEIRHTTTHKKDFQL